MANFLDFQYDQVTNNVHLGSGWTFDQVYHQLEPFGRTVAGARVPGVGTSKRLWIVSHD